MRRILCPSTAEIEAVRRGAHNRRLGGAGMRRGVRRPRGGGGGGGGAEDPISVAPLVAGLSWELVAGVDVTTDTGKIVAWGDQTATGYDVTKAAANAPTDAGGYPDFPEDGSKSLSAGSAWSAIGSASTLTVGVLCVIESVDVSVISYIADPILGDASGYLALVATDDGGGPVISAYGYDGGEKYTAGIAFTPGATQLHIVWRHGGGNLVCRVQADGGAASAQSAVCGNIANTAGVLNIGAGAVAGFDGKILHAWASTAAEDNAVIDNVAAYLFGEY